MARSLVMTVIGPDRPGLVEELSKTIAAHEGSWLESRMAQLAGHFAAVATLSSGMTQECSLRCDP